MNDAAEPPVVAAIVLAAGEGTRMKSATPKVLHELCGRSMLGHVIAALRAANPEQLVVVTGQGRDQVEDYLKRLDPDAVAVFQPSQDGTGHAVRLALQALDGAAGQPIEGTVLVAPGDTPLLSVETMRTLAAHRAKTKVAAVVLTAMVPSPAGYGRIVRDESGNLARIVEHADATEAERAITEINSSVYAFDAAKLRHALAELTPHNAQSEEYLPDVVRILVKGGDPVGTVVIDDWREIAGVNDRVQLAQARAHLRDRLVTNSMRDGVTVIDPATTWIDVDVVLEPDAVVLPNTMLLGRTTIASTARIGPNCSLLDTVVGVGAVVRDATCEGAWIGPQATVGPYTYLRPGTRLLRGAKAGGFVEMKNAVVGEDSKVPHLSYVGDATIGERSNIGAATIFANYDGEEKHATVVGDDVRIGSDTVLVAPVTVGDGAYTAAGSVITDDVPPGALGVARGRQHNSFGWVEEKRPGSASARSAARSATPVTASGADLSSGATTDDNGSPDEPQGDDS
ncbi:MAG TPA: bifunctional UDP-N-acetylglucosamine diphosphorylase/glucosamine-1-phosphate N-acetyltransferase GlmU [Acidothermaceae bacterium]